MSEAKWLVARETPSLKARLQISYKLLHSLHPQTLFHARPIPSLPLVSPSPPSLLPLWSSLPLLLSLSYSHVPWIRKRQERLSRVCESCLASLQRRYWCVSALRTGTVERTVNNMVLLCRMVWPV